MKIIVPCAGKSSRFPNMRPKWMLNAPNGDLMVKSALKDIDFHPDDLVLTILKEHEERYNIIQGIARCFHFSPAICLLDMQTASQSETVYKTIKLLEIDEPVFAKDADNSFKASVTDEDYNYICVSDLNDNTQINPTNKSYVLTDSSGEITSIHEKEVVSSLFSVGGYYFKDVELFCETFEKLSTENRGELYLSVVISEMIQQGARFKTRKVDTYYDWGTIDEWRRYTKQFKVYFIDIDGVIFYNSAQYFLPIWGQTEPIEKNVELIKRLKKAGNQIILTTSRTEEFRATTEAALREVGIEADQLIMGCMHGQRILINDFSKTNQYPSAVAINLPRDSDTLDTMIDI